ncbi:hypothetical protein AB9K26_08375 [Psychroserpens sp. XS_ASV72]|uniref:hypothetical protein n=1 Tax=Psychroserpens sp. XS_ASV72 TaxID=3241293 RepID=UPI003516B1FE
MLGIILIVIIGRQFFKLAEQYRQNKWLFAILGVLSYYVGALVGGVILGTVDAFVNLGIDWDNNLLMTVIALPFGLGTAYLFYYLLNKNWSKNVVLEKTNEIQDIGKDVDDLENYR